MGEIDCKSCKILIKEHGIDNLKKCDRCGHYFFPSAEMENDCTCLTYKETILEEITLFHFEDNINDPMFLLINTNDLPEVSKVARLETTNNPEYTSISIIEQIKKVGIKTIDFHYESIFR